jgi:hypothetical protein
MHVPSLYGRGRTPEAFKVNNPELRRWLVRGYSY